MFAPELINYKMMLTSNIWWKGTKLEYNGSAEPSHRFM